MKSEIGNGLKSLAEKLKKLAQETNELRRKVGRPSVKLKK